MKKKIIIATSLVLAIAVAIFGLSTYQHHQQQEKAKQERDKYKNYDYYTGQWEIDSYKFLDDGRGVVVHWKSLTPEEDKLFAKYNPDLSEKYLGVHGASNERYIIRQNIKRLKNIPTMSFPKDDSESYFKLSIYKIQNHTLKKEDLDLYRFVKKYNKSYKPAEIEAIVEKDGKNYLPIKSYLTTEEKTISKYLWLNLETMQIEWEDTKMQRNNRQDIFVDLGKLRDRISETTDNLSTTTGVDRINQNMLSFRKNTLKNSVLRTTDPKAYQLLSKKDSQFYILIDSKLDYDTVYGNVQKFIELYQLFVPANTNLYEGITIPSELSTDGQVHQVNTKDEFDRYYDVGKDNELNKQRRVLVDQN
ncbi:hypothetical protein [Streptococcus parasanguinis]